MKWGWARKLGMGALAVAVPQSLALQAALAVVTAAVQDGQVNTAEIAQINDLLRPHGLVVRKIVRAKYE